MTRIAGLMPKTRKGLQRQSKVGGTNTGRVEHVERAAHPPHSTGGACPVTDESQRPSRGHITQHLLTDNVRTQHLLTENVTNSENEKHRRRGST